MNPGYLTYILISISMILLASGWKDILLRGVPHTRILLFFIGWFPCSWLHIAMGGYRVELTSVYLPAWAFFCTWMTLRDPVQRVHVWSAGFLLGSFDLLMRELNGWHMLQLQWGPFMNSSVVLAALVLFLGRHPVWQFIAVTAGLSASEWTHVWLHRSADSLRSVGGASFSDHWWLVFVLSRGLTATIEQVLRLSAVAFKHRTTSRKEWGD